MEITLQAQPREILGKKVKSLRTENMVPAVMYGKKTDSIPLVLDRREFLKVAREAGEATIIDLKITGKPDAKVLIRHLQRQPVTDEIIHADFYKIDMTEEIQTEIPLEFEGVSPAVEELEGNLITSKDSIKVECLPNKLVSEIKVDISALKTFEDLIHVSELNVPEGIKVLDDADEIVAQVTPPRSEEELAELEAEATAADTEKAQIESIEADAEAQKAEKEAAEGEPAEGQGSPPETPAPEDKK